MSENASLLRLQQDELLWIRAGDDVARSLADPSVAEELRATLSNRRHGVLFAAPGADLRLQELEVARAERRHLSAALPFTLEESLGEDIENLHFARCDLEAEHIGVAVLRRSCMERWLKCLEPWPELQRWVPEPLLLPWQPRQWTLVLDGDAALLRFGRCYGASVEATLLEPLLAALAEEQSPEAIVVYGEDEAADRALLPESLRERLQWRRGGIGSALLLWDPQEPRPELLQGDYAPQLPYARWWGQWRAVAALLCVAVLLHLASGWLDLWRLERENLALRSEMQGIYRSVNPRGAVVEVETQLRRQLEELGVGETGPGLMVLLAPLGELFAAQEGATLIRLNFNQRSGQLRVNMLAADFNAVEQVRAGLAAAGLSATLENSSRSGEQVLARLRIEAGV